MGCHHIQRLAHHVEGPLARPATDSALAEKIWLHDAAQISIELVTDRQASRFIEKDRGRPQLS
jgi:hypothetical protein